MQGGTYGNGDRFVIITFFAQLLFYSNGRKSFRSVVFVVVRLCQVLSGFLTLDRKRPVVFLRFGNEGLT